MPEILRSKDAQIQLGEKMITSNVIYISFLGQYWSFFVRTSLGTVRTENT